MPTKVIAEAFTPVIKSTLDEIIEKLPNDFVMKENAISNHLKKIANPLTGKGLKDEELKFSGIIDPNSTKKVTKQDLLNRKRKDKFTQTILTDVNAVAPETVLKEFRSPTYREKIRRYNNKGELDRKVKSHYTNAGIDDELYATRSAIVNLNNDDISERGRMIFEFQSDNLQTRRRVGGNVIENKAIIDNLTIKENKLLAEEAELTARAQKINQTKDTQLTDIQNENLQKTTVQFSDKELDKEAKIIFKRMNDITEELSKTRSKKLFAEFNRIKASATLIDPVLRGLNKGDLSKVEIKLLNFGIPKDIVEKLLVDVQLLTKNSKRVRGRIVDVDELKVTKLVDEVFEDPRVQKNLKGQFGFVPDKTPFQDIWLPKAIEDELVDAELENLKFISVPLEVGSDDLIRSPEVQKWYETTVRDNLKKKKEFLNNGIKRRNPDAKADQLFSYDEVTINTEGSKLPKIRSGFEDVDVQEFFNNISREELDFFVSVNSVPGEVEKIADEFIKNGTYTNLFHARSDAVAIVGTNLFDNLTASEANGLIVKTFGGGDLLDKDISHTIGKLILPTNKTMVTLTARKGTEFFPILERQSIVNYVTNSTVDELRILIDNFSNLSKDIVNNEVLNKDFWKPRSVDEMVNQAAPRVGQSSQEFFDAAKLNDIGITRRKREVMNFLEDLPPTEAERISLSTGIKKLSTKIPKSKILPDWIDDIRQYAFLPASTASANEIINERIAQNEVGFNFRNEQKIRDNLAAINDTKLRAEVSKALQGPGATDENVIDAMVNLYGNDRDTSEALVESVMKNKVKGLLDQGATPNEIFEELTARGYKAENIDKYMPSEDALDAFYDIATNIYDMSLKIAENVIEIGTGIELNSENDDTAKIVAMVQSANETQWVTALNLNIPLTREMTIEARNQANAITVEIGKELTEKGIPHKILSNGSIMVQDSNGTFVELDTSFLDTMMARRNEALGALAGGYAGFKLGKKVPGPWWVRTGAVGIGTLGGSALLTGLGRGSDILRNRLYLKQEIDGKFIRDEMLRTGAADGIITLMGAGVIKGGGLSWKFAKWAYDKVAVGNLQGGHRALMEYLHMTPETATEQVEAWVRLNPEAAKGLSKNELTRQFEVLSRTNPLAFRVAQQPMQFDSAAGANMSREINKRRLDLINSVSDKSNENIAAIIKDALPEYEKRVENNYNSIKEIAIQQIRKPAINPDTGVANIVYAFDYNKLVIEPALRDAVEGIDNPEIRKQALNLFTRIRAIGGKKLSVSKNNTSELLLLKNKLNGLTKVSKEVKTKNIKEQIKDLTEQIKVLQTEEVVETNSRRTFSELLELRELVEKFGSKRTITSTKDVAMIETMLSKIDKEITSAARGHLDKETAKNWLKAWSSMKQQRSNLVKLRSNVLVKAIAADAKSEPQVIKVLADKSQSLDGTYREVIQALPIKLRASVEAGTIREFIERSTVGDPSGLQAIDFVKLDKQLKNIPMSTESNKKYKQAISEMARVYKNDPHLLGGSGTVTKEAFTSYLTDDPLIRIKYATISFFFNYIKRLLPGEGGRKAAMLTKLAAVMRKPGDSILVDDLVKQLPPDPAARNKLKELLSQVAESNEISNFPKVEVFSIAPVGDTFKATSGPLGKGRYLFLNKTQARTASRKSSGKLTKELILPDRIADDYVIRNTLGLPENTKITPQMIKGNRELKEGLEQQGYSGIIVDDQIMLF